MAIVKYTRGKAVQITANFKSIEFDCKGKNCRCIVTRVDSKLVRKLQVLRNRAGKSVSINSGNRCKTHNAVVGGATSSYHLNTTGKAADIVVSGMSPAAVAKLAQEIGFTGIGCYTGKQGYFVHVDTRPKRYYWLNTSGVDSPTSTHRGTKKVCPYTLGNSTLRKGSAGDGVRALQWIIDWSGYACSVDGDFGKKTLSALKAFQSDMGLEDDGVAGPLTIAVLKEVVS